MKALTVFVALLVAVTALGDGAAVAPDEVLSHLQEMAIPTELKGNLTVAMQAGMASGRLTPKVALVALERLAALPGEQATEALELIAVALKQGFVVDPLLNEMLKGISLARPWAEVMGVLRLRLALLSATRQVFLSRGVIPSERTAVSQADQLIAETAWAIGDFLTSGKNPTNFAGMEARLRERLTRLRGVISPQGVDQVLAVLSPALVQEIVGLVLQPERR